MLKLVINERLHNFSISFPDLIPLTGPNEIYVCVVVRGGKERGGARGRGKVKRIQLLSRNSSLWGKYCPFVQYLLSPKNTQCKINALSKTKRQNRRFFWWNVAHGNCIQLSRQCNHISDQHSRNRKRPLFKEAFSPPLVWCPPAHSVGQLP